MDNLPRARHKMFPAAVATLAQSAPAADQIDAHRTKIGLDAAGMNAMRAMSR